MYPFTRKDAGARCFDTCHQPFILAQETAWKVNRSPKRPYVCDPKNVGNLSYSKVLGLRTSTSVDSFNTYIYIRRFIVVSWHFPEILPYMCFQLLCVNLS